jgi:hypothetical protein
MVAGAQLQPAFNAGARQLSQFLKTITTSNLPKRYHRVRSTLLVRHPPANRWREN